MRARLALLLLVTGVLGAPVWARGGDLLAREFAAPAELVWMATLAALTDQGWGVDNSDETIGLIVTKSHRFEGDERGMWSQTTRLRLRLSVVPLAEARTRVSVEREMFRRERMLWVVRDEPITVTDRAYANGQVERALLSAIAGAL